MLDHIESGQNTQLTFTNLLRNQCSTPTPRTALYLVQKVVGLRTKRYYVPRHGWPLRGTGSITRTLLLNDLKIPVRTAQISMATHQYQSANVGAAHASKVLSAMRASARRRPCHAAPEPPRSKPSVIRPTNSSEHWPYARPIRRIEWGWSARRECRTRTM